jgi:hypothetical protein
MDDLRHIRETLLADPPTNQATVRARRRLAAAMDGPPGRRRPAVRWAFGGAAVLAGAAAISLAVASTTTTATPGPAHRPGVDAPAELSAQDLLLAAARSAATAEAGRYWHVRILREYGPVTVGQAPNTYELDGRSVDETWIAADPAETSWLGRRSLGFGPRDAAAEQAWIADGAPDQWVVGADTTSGTTTYTTAAGDAEFIEIDARQWYLPDLGGFDAAAVAALPTDAAALRDLFEDRIAADGSAPGTWGANIRLFLAMSQLLVDVPAPPAVRAAAFEVVAGIPGVASTGPVTDAEGRTGVGVELGRTVGGVVERHGLILDPATHVILASDHSGRHTPATGGELLKQQQALILVAEWTDADPAPPAVP